VSVVVGLLLVFRTNSAYDSEESDSFKKKTALQLLIAFPYACMHQCRKEHGVHTHPTQTYREDLLKFAPHVLELQFDSKKDLIDELRLRKSGTSNNANISRGKAPIKNDEDHFHDFSCGCI
ncbi:hypothetical protein HK096_000570, partial [Nowakowskiella sp. JEL0078]